MSSSNIPNSICGSRAMEVMKVRNPIKSQFKVPPNGGVAYQKHKPKILTEEQYIEEMSKIIERDFFPDLKKLRAKNEYLEAEARRDFTKMADIRERYSTDTLPRQKSRCSTLQSNNVMSPATFETPFSSHGGTTPGSELLHTENDEFETTKFKRNSVNLKKLSLDAFLYNYTSEDNESFQGIIRAAESKLRQKYALLYNQEKLSEKQLMSSLLLPSIEQQFNADTSQRKIETWSYTNRNSIMYVPDGVEISKLERIQMAERKQSIQHSATRLTAPDESKGESRAISEPNLPVNPTTTTPRVRGYDLLRSPSPRPGEAFSPIMTWGEIDGTPFRLDEGDSLLLHRTPGPSFRISENSRRENIAIALAEKVNEKMRTQKQQALDTARRNIGSPYVRTNMDRLNCMSPAAKRLATGKLGLRSTPLAFTPSPAQRCSAKSKFTSSQYKTPTTVTTTTAFEPTVNIKSKTNNDPGSSLTNDLLKIPIMRRSTASDFF